MVFGRVIGSAVATRKYPGLEGAKLLVVQQLNKALQPVGRPAIAVDMAQAGVGDIVLMARKREAAVAYYVPDMPLDLAVIAIVDRVDLAQRDLDFQLNEGYNSF
ncbi:MAG TPA: ethanolamine utilization protein EutN [Anaerolineae bacterium]|nr:EutN/CcmL family microcompartment protein [Caldilineae bacterium]HID34031.1 ethanolamine utilization protein EutN [Anaerolineae bacterium]HIQ11838.1 ethanolamine utilization protein EutN [Caldilineales bacterium]